MPSTGAITRTNLQPITTNVINRRSRFHYFGKFLQSIILRPLTKTTSLTVRTIKLVTWDLVKAGAYKVTGYHTESATFLEKNYLNTVKALRDFLFIPSIAKRAFTDMVASREKFVDDIQPTPTTGYVKVDYTKSFQHFSSYMHGRGTFEVIRPEGINEFPATSDPSLQTVMASHIFQPGVMAINFGTPNVATFVTEETEDGGVQTIKVDAKSLSREPMTYHPTNGKIQSGVFLVPTNLPEEAMQRFKDAAKKLEGRKDITCVNTNCRVLQEAGFSIEGVAMDGVVFPGTLMEHLLFRNVFYKDTNGVKHKVHFDVFNTTQDGLEEYLEKVDTAVVGTRLRHRRRHADTEEKQKARGAAAQAIINEEKRRLEAAGPAEQNNIEALGRRKVTVSVASGIGNAIARVWGRHTLYELDLSDKQDEIAETFRKLVGGQGEGESVKLRPFPQKKPSFATRIKRDLLFSGPVIRFLRRHIMGRADERMLYVQDILNHLKGTKGERLNYVLLDNKLVLAKVHVNGGSQKKISKVADWALSKHALLAGRKEVFCSGELWYDEASQSFKMNGDSGTYTPSFERVKTVVELANNIFDTQDLGTVFEAVEAHEEAAEVAKN